MLYSIEVYRSIVDMHRCWWWERYGAVQAACWPGGCGVRPEMEAQKIKCLHHHLYHLTPRDGP